MLNTEVYSLCKKHKDELDNIYFSPNITKVMGSRETRRRGMWHIWEIKENASKMRVNSCERDEKKRNHLGRRRCR